MTENNFPVELPGAKARTLMWANEWEVESQAVQQIRNVGALPWVDELRVMPDVHLGVGATIGTVIGSTSAICPSAVGVDIGCGVNAVKTSLKRDDVADKLKKLRLAFEKAVPVGFNSHGAALTGKDLREIGGNPLKHQADTLNREFKSLQQDMSRIETRAGQQLGTLGGGNHFIELCTDADDNIWITLHSGSRNIGKELAERHIAIAKTLPHNQDLPIKELAVFLKGTPEMEAYRHDLWWAQRYAATSRSIMMGLIKREVSKVLPKTKYEDEINCHHNFVAEEVHDGVELIVTRKGAIRANGGELALIPGSMATGSYIVKGLGNVASLNSASHGAGRKLSRGAAKRAFLGDDNGASEIARQMGDIESRRDVGILDELPDSYKDIHAVIAAQDNLVEVVQHLQTILCVKG
jgi:tRNA-splicing ligase RtcB